MNSEGRPFNRRTMLVSAGIVAVGAGVNLSLRWANGQPMALRFDDLLRAISRFETLGSEYLALYPEEHDLDQLLRNTFGFVPTPSEDADRLVSEVRKRIEHDYLEGKIFRPQGWVLSRTEGRLAALPQLTGLARRTSAFPG